MATARPLSTHRRVNVLQAMPLCRRRAASSAGLPRPPADRRYGKGVSRGVHTKLLLPDECLAVAATLRRLPLLRYPVTSLPLKHPHRHHLCHYYPYPRHLLHNPGRAQPLDKHLSIPQ